MITAIIQARMGSTRLPGKVLMKLEGKTVLDHVINRARQSKFVDNVVVATTIAREDLEIVSQCAAQGVQVYCGSENDVLDRYFQAAKLLSSRHVVRITADCPAIDPEVVGEVIGAHIRNKNDYTSNTLKDTYPDGEDVEVMTYEALREAWVAAELFSEREHVTPYIKKHPEKFRLQSIELQENLAAKRWTIDQAEDYQFLQKIFSKLYHRSPCFGMREILDLLSVSPELELMNSSLVRNEGYQKSLEMDSNVKKDR